jgi:hypothetical protein
MAKRNKERSQWQVVVVVRDQGARRLPRKVYTVIGEVVVCEAGMWAQWSREGERELNHAQ